MYHKVKSSGRKSKETRETYEGILNRSQARFPDSTLPDIVNFDCKVQLELTLGNTEWQPSLDIKNRRKFKEKEVISFDQLHINAVHQRFVPADEMKFLILVDKLLASGTTKYTSRSKIKQALTRTIEAEFPNYSLPNNSLTSHNNKIAELRELFRLQEFRRHFAEEDFQQARTKARETHNFPADNIQRIRPYDLFLQHVKKEGRWTSYNEVIHLWKQLPEEEKSEFEEKAMRVKQDIANFERNKLPQLLNDSTQFYWLLRVSLRYQLSNCYISGFGGEKIPF